MSLCSTEIVGKAIDSKDLMSTLYFPTLGAFIILTISKI